MSALIKKLWWYKPNAYTTTFTLTATFAVGESEYVFTRESKDDPWVASASNDDRLVISLPNDDNGNRFTVRAYVDDPFVDLQATYANATKSNTSDTIGMNRVVFDKTFYSTHPFYAMTGGLSNPYDLFDNDDLGDIYFTNLTEQITLPDKKYTYGPWYGWGTYNETKPYSEMAPAGDGKRTMPLSWIFTEGDSGFPTVSTSESSHNHPNITKMNDVPIVNRVLYMVPIYNFASNYIDIDTHDYRNDGTQVTMYSVNVTAGEGGSVTVSANSVQAGGSVTIEAIPDVGSVFSQWSDGNILPVRTLENIEDDVTLSAQFTTNSVYSVINSFTTNMPNNTGAKLVQGYYDGMTYTFIDVNALPVTYDRPLVQSLPGYRITSIQLVYTPINEGDTIYSSNSSGFTEGTSYTLTSLSDFYTSDLTSASLIDYQADGAPSYLSIHVNLEQVPDCNITINSSNGGTVQLQSSTVAYNSSILLNAVADDGYFFNGYSYYTQRYNQDWFSVQSEPMSVIENITRDITINASFVPITNIIENAVTDYDGNTYDALILGDTVWLKQPFRSRHDSSGGTIEYYAYPNGDINNFEQYGLLYNKLVNLSTASYTNPSGVQSIAPTYWHIPSKAELIELHENNYGLGFLNFKSGVYTEDYDYGTYPPTINVGYALFGECAQIATADGINMAINCDSTSETKYSVVCVYNGSPETLLAAIGGTQPVSHTVALTAGSGGFVSDGGVVLNGGKQQIEATPDSNHLFDKWSDNNTENPRILRNITEDISLTALFKNPDYFYLEAGEANSTVGLQRLSDNNYGAPIQYSTDGTNFVNWESSGTYPTITLSNIGDRVYIRVYQENQDSYYVLGGNVQFVLTGSLTPGGNFGTMFISNGVLAQYQYSNMVSFANCTALTHAPNMNFNFGYTQLGHLYNIFDGCTFNMSDDGNTVNFDISTITYPNKIWYYTSPSTHEGYTTITIHNDYELAQFLGNTTGFTPPA